MRPSPLARLTSVDHKHVGLLYLVTAFLFLLVGGVVGGLLRVDTSIAHRGIGRYDVFAQALSFHATSMVFLFLIPAWIGLGTYLVPLQIGARGTAFPRLAALSYWGYLIGGGIVATSYTVDGGGSTGLPVGLSLVRRSDGTDLLLVGLLVVGTAFVLAALNLIVTVVRLRAPGLTMWRAPAFTWSMLGTSVILLLATPVLLAGLALLYVSLHHGGHVFDPAAGDVFVTLWQHLLWFWGSPLVWVLWLPAFGVVSEVVPVFGRRPLPSHRALIGATAAATTLAFGPWAYELHSLRGKPLLPLFSVPAALVLAPLGLVVLLWLGTMARARPPLAAAPLFALGLLLTVLLAAPLGVVSVLASDVPLERTQFLAGHLHLFLFAPALFGLFAGLFYWVPKMTGRHLSEAAGKAQFLLLLLGTVVAFVPMYVAGLDRMPAGVRSAAGKDRWEAMTAVSAIGSGLLVLAVLVFVGNVARTVWAGQGRAAGADPWDGATLEWVADSPPPPDNFRWLPEVRSERPAADWRTGAAPAIAGDGGGTVEAQGEPVGAGAGR